MPTLAQFDSDRYAATADTRCIKLYIPDDDSYLALVAGILSLAGDPASYIDPESAQTEGVAAVFRDAYIQTDWDGCGTPPECDRMDSSMIIFPTDATTILGNALLWVGTTAQELGGYWQQNPAAQFDEWRLERFFSPGDWAYELVYLRATANGRADLFITQDFSTYQLQTSVDFRGAAANNQRYKGTFTIPSPGGEFHVGIDGTGASSGSSYIRPISRLIFYKTAEP